MPKNKRFPKNYEMEKAARTIDKLAKYDEFVRDIAPELREDLAAGMTREQLREKYSARMAAREISIALNDKDSGKALQAIKQIQDRTEGKPMEKRETTHRFKDMPDQELDALLKSEIADLDSYLN